jgi:hypothetical protein
MDGQGSNSDRDKRLFSPRRPDRLWGPPILLSNGYRGISGWGVKLTSHLQLVLRSKADHSPSTNAEVKNGELYLYSPYVFMA